MRTSKFVKNVVSDLQRKYRVDQYFYPNMSLDTEAKGGLEGEVNIVVRLLKNNGFSPSSDNVFQTMQLKKTLLERYMSERGSETLKNYRELMLEEIKPVGIVESIEFCLVNGLIVVGLYLLGRFAGSFADESGRLAARKILGETKKGSKELKIDIREYKILANELNLFIEKKEILNLAENTLKKKRKKRSNEGKRSRKRT